MLKLPIIKIYDRYIFTQIFAATFIAILLFTVVWIAPEMLLKTIEKTTNKIMVHTAITRNNERY